MKLRPLLAASLAVLAWPAVAANVDVGVSIQISQPGVYGRIDLGRYPQPQVVYAQPIYVERPRYVVAQPEPVYMWVPPGHRKNWKRYCKDYRACGTPVVFVRDDWYDQNVRPQGKGKGRDNGHGHGNGQGKGKGGRDD